MTRTSKLLSVVAIVVGIAAPAFASDQLAASAGLTSSEAAGMSLSEIAATKFNRGVPYADRQAVSIQPGQGGSRGQLAATAGVSPSAASGMSLNDLVVAKYNAESGRDDQQGVVISSGVTQTSRSYGVSAGRSQLISNAGLTSAEAQGLTLSEIAAYKFNRGATSSDMQTVPTWK